MIQQTIDALREMKKAYEYDGFEKEIAVLNQAIIACEQCRKARKKAKRWKRKYLELRAEVEKNMKLDALYERLMAEKNEKNNHTDV